MRATALMNIQHKHYWTLFSIGKDGNVEGKIVLVGGHHDPGGTFIYLLQKMYAEVMTSTPTFIPKIFN
jgi:hypothetical protein